MRHPSSSCSSFRHGLQLRLMEVLAAGRGYLQLQRACCQPASTGQACLPLLLGMHAGAWVLISEHI